MAGPPQVLSSSTNTAANAQKDGKATEDQPCPKRRKKSIDELNSIETAQAQAPAPAGGESTQDGEGTVPVVW